MQKNQFVAIDTNIALLLASENELATDAIALIQKRLQTVKILASRTVVQELTYQAKNELDINLRNAARKALADFSRHKIEATPVEGVLEAIVSKAADTLRHAGLIPLEERNDALIVAESAALNCILLVSNDSHLLNIDPKQLSLLFIEMDLPSPLIVSPRELIEKFYR